MRKSLLSIVFALLGTLCGYASENYLPGWIVTNEGETVNGYIDFQDWVKNPSFIFFKNGEAGVTEKLNPFQIKSFSVNNDVYESFTVEYNTSSREISKLEYDPHPRMVKKQVFLKLLFGGKLDLYKLTIGNNQAHFLCREGDNIPKELLYHVYLTDLSQSEGGVGRSMNGVIRKQESYKTQLQFAMRDCEKIKSSQFKKLPYVEKSFLKIFQTYQEACGEKEVEYKVTEKKLKTQIGIYAGGGLTSFSASSTHPSWQYLDKGEITPGFGLTAGMFLELVIPGRWESWSLYNELGFSQLNAESSFEPSFYWPGQYSVKGSYSISYVGLTSSVRKYITPLKPYKYYVELGAYGRLAVGEDLIKKEKDESGDFQESVAIKSIRKIEFGATIGVGCKYKKFGVGLNCYFGDGFSEYVFLKTRTNSVALKVSYQL